MEGLVNPNREFWSGRRVFLTGHTGFKGSWIALWLSSMGAEVHGFALDPSTVPAICNVASVAQGLASDTRADLADRLALNAAIEASQPSVIFHLAAQPLVRESYRLPLETFSTNVMGTANVLEAARDVTNLEAVVVVTTDKVYANSERSDPFREDDPLGGDADPYSASKAATEFVAAAWRRSFLAAAGVNLATARAGNVIGGGDWSADRLVPDCLRSFEAGEPVQLRYPNATRPWQHVIEPVAGYLILAERLSSPAGADFASGWNYGPSKSSEASVGEVAQKMAEVWGDAAEVRMPDRDVRHFHEAGLLRLDSQAVQDATGWKPRWSLDKTLERTVAWQRAYAAGRDMRAHSLADIAAWQGNER